MPKLTIIEAKDIKKEIPNNNHIYIKLTKYQAYKWLNYSYFTKKFNLVHKRNQVELELNLPAFRDSSIYDKLVKEPVYNEIIDMLIITANMIFEGRFKKPKTISKLEKLKTDIQVYENEILQLDEELSSLKEN